MVVDGASAGCCGGELGSKGGEPFGTEARESDVDAEDGEVVCKGGDDSNESAVLVAGVEVAATASLKEAPPPVGETIAGAGAGARGGVMRGGKLRGCWRGGELRGANESPLGVPGASTADTEMVAFEWRADTGEVERTGGEGDTKRSEGRATRPGERSP